MDPRRFYDELGALGVTDVSIDVPFRPPDVDFPGPQYDLRRYRLTFRDGRQVELEPPPSETADEWVLAELRKHIERERQPPPEIDGEVIGFREWIFARGGLAPIGVHTPPWTRGVNEAKCHSLGPLFGSSLEPHERHPAPDEDCECGLYGLIDPKPTWSAYPMIVGALRAWGDRFVLQPTGFRAQFAEVTLLAVHDAWPEGWNRAIRIIADDYGADVCDLSYLKDAAKEHGQLVPQELLPELPESERLSSWWGRGGFIGGASAGGPIKYTSGRVNIPLASHSLHVPKPGDLIAGLDPLGSPIATGAVDLDLVDFKFDVSPHPFPPPDPED